MKNIIVVREDGQVTPGTGYTIGQLLEAIELARRVLLGLVPAPEPTDADKTGAPVELSA